MEKLESYTEADKARLVSEEYGPHLPGLGSNPMSKIFVLEKI
ncbi:hypothetical protein AIOL_002240 [Candidatus Rhodobacter oscarellae]|uniref:Uncharacterized protein n=1 Tax=Candidatus Rhodobacter oscarellae TaxID=1675527 RepID=A0A0J9E627_9RHOB|nr:hypothetical protein [Candidatus Rhodobacter lobularis]KMW57279.1 hypothetical protein AIOL_002240 [Candidatus Rhodobacter lobularis]